MNFACSAGPSVRRRFERCIPTANRKATHEPCIREIFRKKHSTKVIMTTKLSLWIFASVLASGVYAADEKAPADDWKPASSNQSGKEYPKVNSEGRVKFRIMAPDAKSVGCT